MSWSFGKKIETTLLRLLGMRHNRRKVANAQHIAKVYILLSNKQLQLFLGGIGFGTVVAYMKSDWQPKGKI